MFDLTQHIQNVISTSNPYKNHQWDHLQFITTLRMWNSVSISHRKHISALTDYISSADGQWRDILGSTVLLLPEQDWDFCLWLVRWKDLLSGAQDRCLESIWVNSNANFSQRVSFGGLVDWLVGCRFEGSVSLEISHSFSFNKGESNPDQVSLERS